MKQSIHICHVQTSFGSGGLENGVVNIVNGLDPETFRSTVICLHEGGVLAERVTNPKAEVIYLDHPDRLAPELPFRLAKLFRRLAPDIVHTRNYTANLYGTLGARLAHVPTVVNGEHGLIQLVGRRKQLVSRFVALGVDHVLCVSPGLRDFLVSELRYPPDSVHVIINGVDLSRFELVGSAGAAKRRELGIPDDVWLLGMISRFIDIKDNPAMLSLLERVPEVDGRPVHAILIGDGQLAEEFRAETERRNLGARMHLPGFRQDVGELYSMFDVFCLFSNKNEGTSNVLLEAMASALPIVTTDLVGNRHLIKGGWNGVLVPPQGEPKLQALAKEIPALLRDQGRREILARNGKNFVQEHYELHVMIENYGKFYRSLVA